MDDTPNLKLPYIMAAQAQKHVTHNEALRALDAVIQLSVLDRDLALPPATPADGDRYIIGPSSGGDWSSHDNSLAVWQDNAWAFHAPQEGWLAWVRDENQLLAFDGSAWNEISGSGGSGSIHPAALVGVNSTADTINRLSVSSPNTLLSHEGSDHRVKINKATIADTASFLFQDGFSGRAEIGLTGDDDFHFKVSSDGTSFKEAIIIDKDNGSITLPNTSPSHNYLMNGDFAINQRQFLGGVLTVGEYGYDRWKADTGGANVSVSGDVITLTSGAIVQVIESPDLAEQQLVLSVEDLSGGNLDIDIAGQTGTIAAGAGRRRVSLTLGSADTGNIAIRLSPSSSEVTFARVQVERGALSSGWITPHHASELARCQRYYFHSITSGTQPVDGAGLSGALAVSAANTLVQGTMVAVRFPSDMRAGPTITTLNPQSTIAADSGKFYNSFGNHIAATVGYISNKGCSIWNAETTSAGAVHYIHVAVDAEL